MKKLFKKMIVLILTAVLLTLPLQSVQVQAAGMSYSKAMKMARIILLLVYACEKQVY